MNNQDLNQNQDQSRQSQNQPALNLPPDQDHDQGLIDLLRSDSGQPTASTPPQNHAFLLAPSSRSHRRHGSDDLTLDSVASSPSLLSTTQTRHQRQHQHGHLHQASLPLNSYSQDFDGSSLSDGYTDSGSIEPHLRRRRQPSFNLQSSASLAPRSRSMASRSSTSSIRDTFLARAPSPTHSSVGSKRSSLVQNRSSMAIAGTEHSGGWISGLSEVMANVSSRVVNSRSQEQMVGGANRSSLQSHTDLSDGETYEQLNSRNSFGLETPVGQDAPPWVALSQHTAGSEHGSVKLDRRRSGSKKSSTSQPAGSNLGVKTSQQGGRGLFQSSDRSGTGSNIGKAYSTLHEKAQQDETEPAFVPGGFVHRGGDKMRLEGRSLFIFSPDNPIRKFLATILMSKYTDPVILVIILLEWVIFVITPTTFEAKNIFGSHWTHYALLAINTLYTLEILSKAVVYGLFFDRKGFQAKKLVPKPIWRLLKKLFPRSDQTHRLTHIQSTHSRSSTHEKTNYSTTFPATTERTTNKAVVTDLAPAHAPFFQSYYNRLDTVVVTSYWVDLAFMIVGIREVYIFKAISALRPLRLLSLTEGTSTIMSSLSISAPLLLTILGFIFFFFLILSLIGLLVFQGSLSRRCAIQQEDDPNVWVPVSPQVICGGFYSNGTLMGIVNYIGQGDGDDASPRTTGMICPEGQICMQFPDYNPSLGLVSFDNFFFSLLTVFTISSMEGWTDVEYWVMDGDSKFAAIFFCVAIFLMSFLMIPLFIAGITYSFGAVRAEKRHSAFSNKPRSTRILLDTDEGWQFEDQVRQSQSPLQQQLVKVINSSWFPILGACVVFLNLVAMCFRRYDSSPEQIHQLDHAELGFTAFFALEIVIRMLGHSSLALFWKKKSNVFDCFLAVMTLVILLPSIHHWKWFRYLTIFQVLRSYRLIPVIPGVRDLMRSVIGSATGMMNLLLITFMFLLVCAPIPMMLFGGDMESEEIQPMNFDDLGQSFISLFVILTGENWVNIMYEGLDSHPQRYKQIYGAFFFVIYYCASHYVLLNLFIAIVLEHFELEDDEKYRKQLEMYFEKHQRSKKDSSRSFFQYFNPYAYLPSRPQTLRVHGLTPEQTGVIRKTVFREFLEGDSVQDTSNIMETKNKVVILLVRFRDYWFPTQAQIQEAEEREYLESLAKKRTPEGAIQTDTPVGFGKSQREIDASLERLDAGLEKITWDMEKSLEDPQKPSSEALLTNDPRKKRAKEQPMTDEKIAETREFLEAHPMYDRSLFILPSNNRFRQLCRRVVGPRTGRQLVTMNKFNWFIFATILLSIAVVIADDPTDRLQAVQTGNTRRQDILKDIDNATTLIFVAEQFLRILADGFLFTPTGYIRDPWNLLDLFIVVMSCVMAFAELDHLYSVSRAVRAMSCLRVIRIVRYFEGISAMFLAITRALPRMVVAMILTALLFWPFAIYGVNIYAGYFYLCNDHTVLSKHDCVGEFMNEPSGDDNGDILIPRVWSNPYDYSFDSVSAAVLTLFEMASQEGWILVLQSGRAVPDHLGEQPFIRPDEPNRFNSFYFILFMLIGSIVFVQIFIGVILETFKTWNGIALLTVEQRRWLDLRRQLRLIKPTAIPARPTNRIRAFCYDMVIKKKGVLWRIMTVVLVLNVILIASQHYGQPQSLTDVQDVSYFIFLGLYSVEILIKLCGYGFHKWRLSRWNLYDMAITVLALITLIPRFVGHQLWTLRLEKFLLITISFRLAQRIDSLQVLFRALVIALGSIMNITAVFMVVFTVYAIMFRELFGTTRLGPSTTGLANFSTFGNTMLMLVRMTTGENWDFVMHDMMVEPPYCTPTRNTYLDSDCGSKPWAYFMFLSFYIVCTYILLNMFIAVIISNFSFAYQQDSLTTLITREDLRNFKMTWAKFDPRGTGYIEPKYLSKFLRSLDGRLCTRAYEDPEYSIPNLVKAYSTPGGIAVPPVVSTATEAPHHPVAPPSPSTNSHRSVLGLGPSRLMSRLTRSPSLSGSGHHRTSPKVVPIAVYGPDADLNDEKAAIEITNSMDMPSLLQALSKIDPMVVYQRRQVLNAVYKEAMATATARGISFYSILDILSFTLVDVEQALGMEEFLKRNERVKEVKAAVARETIHNLLLTIIARRSFLKQRRVKQNSRLRPDVPRIVIDTSVGNERSLGQDTSPMLTSSPSGRTSMLPSPLLDFSKGHSGFSSDEDHSPIGYSTSTMLSIGSNDSHGWDAYERDSYNRQSVQSDGSESVLDPRLPQTGQVEGTTWFNMLQEEIREQEETQHSSHHQRGSTRS